MKATTVFIIRNYPKIEVVLHADYFTLYDAKRDQQQVAYNYEDLIGIKRLIRKPDWLTTGLLSVVGLFFGTIEVYHHPEKLWFRLKGRERKIPLKNCDMGTVNQFILALREKIPC